MRICRGGYRGIARVFRIPSGARSEKKNIFWNLWLFLEPSGGSFRGFHGTKKQYQTRHCQVQRFPEGSRGFQVQSRGWQAPSVEHRGFHWALEPSQIRPCGYVVELRRAQLAHWVHVHIETIENSYMFKRHFPFGHYITPFHCTFLHSLWIKLQSSNCTINFSFAHCSWDRIILLHP